MMEEKELKIELENLENKVLDLGRSL